MIQLREETPVPSNDMAQLPLSCVVDQRCPDRDHQHATPRWFSLTQPARAITMPTQPQEWQSFSSARTLEEGSSYHGDDQSSVDETLACPSPILTSSASTLANIPRIGSTSSLGSLGKSRVKTSKHQGLPSSGDWKPLPPKRGSKTYRFLRWNFGSVYRRIFTLAFLGNLVAILVLTALSLTSPYRLTHSVASTAVSANILAAMLVRNEHVVNALFLVFGTWPRRAPLPARRLFAKVYSYGGIHSGCGVAAVFWYAVFLVLLALDLDLGRSSSLPAPRAAVRTALVLVSYAVALLLLLILVFAHPALRVRLHNWFECTHRFLGWSAILLFWVQILLSAADVAADGGSGGSGGDGHSSFGSALAATPSFWLLTAVTLLVVYPWTQLRRRAVEAEVLSDHVVKLTFAHDTVHYGQAVRLTDAPLRETHAFAVIPNPPIAPTSSPCDSPTTLTTNTKKETKKTPCTSPRPQKGFSVLVSRAGDWTSRMIRAPPTRIYTRGRPQYGVLRVAGLFSPVIIVATGSGIGPCLSLFVERPAHPVRIVWSASAPERTYGAAVLRTVYAADPDAVVIDTRAAGRPDLVRIVYGIWEESRRQRDGEREERDGDGWDEKAAEEGRAVGVGTAGQRRAAGPCEAVVMISNQAVTRKVIYGLESRGVPAYGAIFDS